MLNENILFVLWYIINTSFSSFNTGKSIPLKNTRIIFMLQIKFGVATLLALNK